MWKKPLFDAHPQPPLWSPPRGGHTLVAPSTLHSSAVCHGCFKSIWPACANGRLFWERDGKTVCYSQRPLWKKYGLLRGRFSCVCVCVCSQPAIPVTKFHVGVMCRCRPLGLLLKHEISYSCKTKTLKLIPQQVRLVNFAFCPHHYLGFMRAFYFGYFISSPSEVLPVCTCSLPQKCPSYANFKINFFL